MNAKNDSTTPSFDQFWDDSTYSRFSIKEFAAAQERYNAKEKAESLLEYPPAPQKLPVPKTHANSLARKRKSERLFGADELTQKELGTILSSFYGFNGLEHRAFPSAGGSYAVEVFCVANRVHGYSGKLLYYNADLNAVTVLGDAPSWEEMAPNVNVQVEGVPQCLLIFTIFPERLTTKYLERGGRFALIEVGAAVQQLAIQIAGSRKLKGVAVGGLVDDYWLNAIGLRAAEAKMALGYLCGK